MSPTPAPRKPRFRHWLVGIPLALLLGLSANYVMSAGSHGLDSSSAASGAASQTGAAAAQNSAGPSIPTAGSAPSGMGLQAPYTAGNWAQAAYTREEAQAAAPLSAPQGKLTRDEVIHLLRAQGKDTDYYTDGLSFELADVNGDGAPDLVARIDGAVHLGHFFLLLHQPDGGFTLVHEQAFKVDTWDLTGRDIGGKRMFETVTADGGTGGHEERVRLWYVENGQYIEAWNGIMTDRQAMLPQRATFAVGSCRITDDLDGPQLFHWVSRYGLSEDGELTGDPDTKLERFAFDGTRFTPF
ncbi:hypothetical protein [Paenibacillus sp. y28]|uniref:hypothetical protein n=1 Tax=Paenibacillus sp. y28 TaxID=3129110 RepID=UPI003017A906